MWSLLCYVCYAICTFKEYPLISSISAKAKERPELQSEHKLQCCVSNKELTVNFSRDWKTNSKNCLPFRTNWIIPFFFFFLLVRIVNSCKFLLVWYVQYVSCSVLFMFSRSLFVWTLAFLLTLNFLHRK